MSQRTTIKLVKEKLTGDYDSVNMPGLQTFINTAANLTDRVVACAVAKGITLTSTDTDPNVSEQTDIETLLACHFYKYARDKQVMSKSTAGASGTFAGQTAMYLEGTTYGQSAMSADYSGCLQAIAMGQNKKKARGAWLGRTISEQRAYYSRR